MARFERARGRECADVQFVNDGAAERRRLPAAVSPGKGAVVDEARRAVDARWLPGGTGIRKGRVAAVEHIEVIVARFRSRYPCAPVPAFLLFESDTSHPAASM